MIKLGKSSGARGIRCVGVSRSCLCVDLPRRSAPRYDIRLTAFTSQTQDLMDNIPIILPPLLNLMDDYKSTYRIRGLQVLPAFLRMPTHVLHRTGIAQLLLRSIQHSISLHPTPPEPPLLEVSLERLFDLLHVLYPAGQGKEAEAAKQVEEAVEKGIINGWAYAKSGQEGVEALMGVAKAVEMVCREVDLGVIRWMRVCCHSGLINFRESEVTYTRSSRLFSDIHPVSSFPSHDAANTLHHPCTTRKPECASYLVGNDREDQPSSKMARGDSGRSREDDCGFA